MKPQLCYIVPVGDGARPDNDLPSGAHPDHDLPVPPPSVWPPLPPDASHKPIELPPPIHKWPPTPIFPVPPNSNLPADITIWPPLPPDVPAGLALVLVYVFGVGHRWLVVDVPQPK